MFNKKYSENRLEMNFQILLDFIRDLKSDSHFLSLFCVNESALKMMKNYFYLILKALFVLKMFKFLS